MRAYVHSWNVLAIEWIIGASRVSFQRRPFTKIVVLHFFLFLFLSLLGCRHGIKLTLPLGIPLDKSWQLLASSTRSQTVVYLTDQKLGFVDVSKKVKLSYCVTSIVKGTDLWKFYFYITSTILEIEKWLDCPIITDQ